MQPDATGPRGETVPRKRNALAWLGATAAIAGTAYLFWAAAGSLDVEALRERFDAAAWTALAIAACCYAATVPLAAWAWQRLLRGLEMRAAFRPLLAILLVTQIGKYLPGNVGHLVGRSGFALRAGMPAATLATSILYEIALLLATGVAVGVVSLVASPALYEILGTSHASSLALGVGVAAALFLVAFGWRTLLARGGRFLPRVLVEIGASPRLGASAMAMATSLYAAAYLAIGLSALVMAHGLRPAAMPDLALLTGAFSIAWVVGFVTPGAPAGIGVREALLLLMLAPSLGRSDATMLVLSLRVATMLGDTLCLLAGMALLGHGGITFGTPKEAKPR